MYIKKQRHHFADEDPHSQTYGFSSSYAWMWELDHKEGWAPKNWCFQIVVLEKTLENPIESMEIKPVNCKEINPEYSLEGLMLKVKLQYFGQRQEDKVKTEDEMVGWQHQLNGHEFEQTLGDGEGRESLACCSPWGHKELDMT